MQVIEKDTEVKVTVKSSQDAAVTQVLAVTIKKKEDAGIMPAPTTIIFKTTKIGDSIVSTTQFEIPLLATCALAGETQGKECNAIFSAVAAVKDAKNYCSFTSKPAADVDLTASDSCNVKITSSTGKIDYSQVTFTQTLFRISPKFITVPTFYSSVYDMASSPIILKLTDLFLVNEVDEEFTGLTLDAGAPDFAKVTGDKKDQITITLVKETTNGKFTLNINGATKLKDKGTDPITAKNTFVFEVIKAKDPDTVTIKLPIDPDYITVKTEKTSIATVFAGKVDYTKYITSGRGALVASDFKNCMGDPVTEYFWDSNTQMFMVVNTQTKIHEHISFKLTDKHHNNKEYEVKRLFVHYSYSANMIFGVITMVLALVFMI